MDKIVNLDKFQPRDYQWTYIDAVLAKGYKNVICCWPRRAGKDLTTWQIVIDIAIHKTCIVYYMGPTYTQIKKIIWNAISKEGVPFLDFIPKDLISSINASELKITLKNKSIIQLVGAENYNKSFLGSNPYVIVFTEFSVMDEARQIYEFASPIVAESDGICLFLFTPRGRNYAYNLYEAAKDWKDWYVSKLTLHDTKHIPLSVIDREREKFSEEFIQQEYFTDFSRGIEGSVFGRYVETMRNRNRITTIDYDPRYKVHSAWDLGNNKNMAVILYQIIGKDIMIIDTIQLKDGALPEYISELKKKPYVYGIHVAPHDIRVHDLSTNITRWGMAMSLGIQFTKAPEKSDGVGLQDGIETTKAIFNRLWIDSKCERLIESLENYRYTWDEKNEEYSKDPAKGWPNHFVDAVRYMAITLDKTSDDLTAEDLDKRFAQSRNQGNPMNSVFDQPFPGYK